MNPHSEIKDDTRFVQMNIPTIQAMIKYNKKQIRELQTERDYLRHLTQLYYNSCDKIDPYGILSSTSFTCLNSARDELVSVKKRLKLFAEVQHALKKSIRG